MKNHQKVMGKRVWFHVLPRIVMLDKDHKLNDELKLVERVGFKEGVMTSDGRYYIEQDSVAVLSSLQPYKKLKFLMHEVCHALIWRVPFHCVRENFDWFWDCVYVRRRIDRDDYIGFLKLYRNLYGRFSWLFGFNKIQQYI